MIKYLHLILLLSLANANLAQQLDVQTFGNKKDKAVIFMHGGPGYNSVAFEQTTAEELASHGFYVISYDRRGEGRNEAIEAAYTFDQTFADLNEIYASHDLKKATILGHSFGGVVGTLYAEQYPEKIQSLVLLGAPISLQETLKNIITKAKGIYEEKEDKVNLNYIGMLEKMDTSSLEYSAYTFMHAMSNGFYTTKSPNEKAVRIYEKFQSDSLLMKYGAKMGYLAPQNFWKNEKYTTINLQVNIENLQTAKVPTYAIYGKEDGLYAKEQVEKVEAILGKEKVKYLDNCSHNVFIDQQDVFFDLLKEWTK